MQNVLHFILFFLGYIGYQVSVLAKLDTIIENQQEQLLLLRNITASTHVGSGEALEELIPSKINSVGELKLWSLTKSCKTLTSRGKWCATILCHHFCVIISTPFAVDQNTCWLSQDMIR